MTAILFSYGPRLPSFLSYLVNVLDTKCDLSWPLRHRFLFAICLECDLSILCFSYQSGLLVSFYFVLDASSTYLSQ